MTFRLYAWTRNQMELDALLEHIGSRYWTTYSAPLASALANAKFSATDRANESLRHLTTSGGLLFAWYGTTALDNVAAVAQ